MNPNRYFDAEPGQRKVARELYNSVAALPIVSPHGHVDPKLFVGNSGSFGTPSDMLIIPDHYVFRMLYSQGHSLESLGIPRIDGKPVESDHRKIWQVFADNYSLFRGTPSGSWLNQELEEVFGITMKLNGTSGQDIYDQISEKLASPEFQPRALFDKFNIEVLCTTDSATDDLDAHRKIADSDWDGKIIPTFRPDSVVNLNSPNWNNNIEQLSDISGMNVSSYPKFIGALESRRAYFKEMGAKATDHAVYSASTQELSPQEAEQLFQKALIGEVTSSEAQIFVGHMLTEFARMSIDDGLVMQIHVGSARNHNKKLFDRFGPDKGADIPVRTEFTESFSPLLQKFGNQYNLTIILFALDESTLSRELAPLAGHYPAIKLGPPWWFYDSVNGIRRYFDRVIETAGLYNTAGFNDDTRAFPSIPARHDVWRRVSANWLAGLVVTGVIDEEDASEMIVDLAYNLVKRAYNL
jgi:glucuronate isomerase